MYYSDINKCDVANGLGCRVTLYVSGCRNHCEGCFQPQTWDFEHGREFTNKTRDYIIEACGSEHIRGLTLLGGDPFEPENQSVLADLTTLFKEKYPQKDIWAYTGYLVEDLVSGSKNHTESTEVLLNNVDVLIDGPFILSERNLALKFRGSNNQRLLRKDERGCWYEFN